MIPAITDHHTQQTEHLRARCDKHTNDNGKLPLAGRCDSHRLLRSIRWALTSPPGQRMLQTSGSTLLGDTHHKHDFQLDSIF